jgi:hypothetical protein
LREEEKGIFYSSTFLMDEFRIDSSTKVQKEKSKEHLKNASKWIPA